MSISKVIYYLKTICPFQLYLSFDKKYLTHYKNGRYWKLFSLFFPVKR